MNKHNYSITDMYRNLSNTNRLQEILSDKDGPENPRRHRKGEEIWFKGHTISSKPKLQDFPDNETIVKYWDAGLKEPQRHLESLQVKPRRHSSSDKENEQFYHPHVSAASDDGHSESFEGEDQEHGSASFYEPESDEISIESQELGSHLCTIADDLESDIDTDEHLNRSVLPKLTLNCQGVEIHKSTAVAMLDSNPNGINESNQLV